MDAVVRMFDVLSDRTTPELQRLLVERALRRVEREVAPFGLPPYADSSPLNPIVSGRKLHVGSGANHIQGWTNVDLGPPADVICDIRAGLPFPEGSCDLVFSEHFLEHVDYDLAARSVVSEMFRVLESRGEVVIGVPDAEAVVRAYAFGSTQVMNELRERWYLSRDASKYSSDFDLVNLVFSDEYSSPKYHPHHWAYSFRSLSILMEGVGFRSIEALSERPAYSNPERSFCTLYVRGVKP